MTELSKYGDSGSSFANQNHVESMKPIIPTNASPLCPSTTHPEQRESVVFGVVGGTVESPRLAYLREPQPVTDELLAVSGSVAPTEVFRFAAPCAGSGCKHFDGTDCRLIQRIVNVLPTVVDVLPACQLRSSCRWWQQEGKAACLRCPQVVTKTYNPSDTLRQVASPSNNG
ncbi:MAG TPA: nitrogen fixation protein [Allocoleopsis sp.]